MIPFSSSREGRKSGSQPGSICFAVFACTRLFLFTRMCLRPSGSQHQLFPFSYCQRICAQCREGDLALPQDACVRGRKEPTYTANDTLFVPTYIDLLLLVSPSSLFSFINSFPSPTFHVHLYSTLTPLEVAMSARGQAISLFRRSFGSNILGKSLSWSVECSSQGARSMQPGNPIASPTSFLGGCMRGTSAL